MIAPLLVAGVLLVSQLVVAGWALVSAGEAARIGARAAHVGGDVEESALNALPAPLAGAEVNAKPDEVRVEVRAPALLPGIPSIPVAASAALRPGAG